MSVWFISMLHGQANIRLTVISRKFRFQCIKECMNQFSDTQWSITTAGYDELREPPSPTNCHPFLFFRCLTSLQKPSAICVLWLLFACIQLSLLKASEVKNLMFIRLGKVNIILLTGWQEESYQCLRQTYLSNTPSIKSLIPCNLYARLLLVLSSKISFFMSPLIVPSVLLQTIKYTYVTINGL